MATGYARAELVTGVRVDPSFEAFVEARSAGLLRTAYLLTLDRGHAEDLLQTALLRAARHWRNAREAPEAYVRTILVNLCRDRRRLLRRRPVEAPLPPDAASAGGPDSPADQVAERRVVAQALAALPLRQRQVVVLRFYEDLSVTETARLLGFSEGTVKSYTARALSRLRELLADADAADAAQPYTVEVRHAHR
jgi:RNA polymerase sigma-70 factor (sigma-E family)